MTATITKSIPVSSPASLTSTLSSRTSPRVPMSQPAAAVRQNSETVVLRTGTPSSRAAVRAPPLAKTALPNFVRNRAHAASAVAASHHSSDTWKRPSPTRADEPKMPAASPHPGASSRPLTCDEPVMASKPARDVPCSTRNVASVTRKLGSPVLTTSTPLTTPTTSAASSDTRSAGQVDHPAGPISRAVISEDATATTPIDRSNWPATSNSATATPPMPRGAATSRTPARPLQVSRVGAWSSKKTTTTTSPTSAGRLGRASASPSSRRPREGCTRRTALPMVGRRSLITGGSQGAAGVRWGYGTSAVGPPRRGAVAPVSTTTAAVLRAPARPRPEARREAASGEEDEAFSGLEQPAHGVVGVPGPAADRARVRDAVPHDARRVGRPLQSPSAGVAGGPQRLGHHGDADRVDGPPVRAHVDP